MFSIVLVPMTTVPNLGTVDNIFAVPRKAMNYSISFSSSLFLDSTF